ncbi:MAG: hypothetical protein AB1305_02880 [Candidatus Hadarchaeota archaeon]
MAPPAPALISPKSGSATDNTPEFEWSSVDDPSGVAYDLQYSNSDNFPESWLEGQYDMQKYQFRIWEDPGSISKMDAQWEGFGQGLAGYSAV